MFTLMIKRYFSSGLRVVRQPYARLSTFSAEYPKSVFLCSNGSLQHNQRYKSVSIAITPYDKDLAYLPQWTRLPVVQVDSVVVKGEFLEVGFSAADHDSCCYPLEWLRDVCRCSDCFNCITYNKRTAVVPHVPKLREFRITENGKAVHVIWEDGHESTYPQSFLLFQHFHSMNARAYDNVIDVEREHWDASIPEDRFRRYDFESIINDDRALFGWLMDLRQLGYTVIKNSPTRVGELSKLCERVAYTRRTCFGRTFQVEVKEDASHLAYSSGRLPLHTDTAYYMFPVGVQLLHCIKQSSSGGENIVADAFRAAEIIRREDPDCFQLLTSVEFEYFDIGYDHVGKHHLQSRHPVIRLDRRGRIEQIVYADHSRACRLDGSIASSPEAYRALRKFSDTLNNEDSVLKYKLQEGEILVVDNYRVPHGRLKIDPNSSRHFEGAYLDWDEICSRIRVLGSKFR